MENVDKWRNSMENQFKMVQFPTEQILSKNGGRPGGLHCTKRWGANRWNIVWVAAFVNPKNWACIRCEVLIRDTSPRIPDFIWNCVDVSGTQTVQGRLGGTAVSTWLGPWKWDDLMGCKKSMVFSAWNTGPLKCPFRQLGVHHITKWWFPKIGVPLNHPFLDGIFPYKPSIWGYPHGHGNPQIVTSLGPANPHFRRRYHDFDPIKMTVTVPNLLSQSPTVVDDRGWRRHDDKTTSLNRRKLNRFQTMLDRLKCANDSNDHELLWQIS